MITDLPLFHRIRGEPVIVLGEGDAAEARRRLVERAGGISVDDLEEGLGRSARIAFVAHHEPASCEADAYILQSAGVLVNVPDRPDLCDFTVPSILDRSPVLLAIGTGGASAGLAKALRLRLETLLPVSLGRLAQALATVRGRIRGRWPEASERRRAIDAALAEGGALDPLQDNSADQIERWLADTASSASDEVFEFRLASSDPDDLSLRQSRALGSADLIAHEEGAPAAILDRARADAARVVIGRGEAAPDAPGLVVVLRLA